jgi:trans-2,3-dihydro-3-hydroxyanthranilate isomerase
MMASTYDYAIYDVFTERALAGNPLAVVFDADGLAGDRMQAVAQEFNLSETVFVSRASLPAHAARLRIFTPQRELPFAGHPTVGAAIAVARRRRDALVETGQSAQVHDLDSVMVLEEEIGAVRAAVRLANGHAAGATGFAEFDLPRLSQPVPASMRREDVARALGIGAQDINFENHVISTWSAGVPFVMVPVHDRAVVARCQCDAARWEAIAPLHNGQIADVYVYCRGGIDHEARFHARMFAPHMGIAEDPATGSAVAALSGAVHRFDAPLDGHHALTVEQGVEMGRPSKIHLHIDVEQGAIVRARIGGHAVRVAMGQLQL